MHVETFNQYVNDLIRPDGLEIEFVLMQVTIAFHPTLWSPVGSVHDAFNKIRVSNELAEANQNNIYIADVEEAFYTAMVTPGDDKDYGDKHDFIRGTTFNGQVYKESELGSAVFCDSSLSNAAGICPHELGHMIGMPHVSGGGVEELTSPWEDIVPCPAYTTLTQAECEINVLGVWYCGSDGKDIKGRGCDPCCGTRKLAEDEAPDDCLADWPMNSL